MPKSLKPKESTANFEFKLVSWLLIVLLFVSIFFLSIITGKVLNDYPLINLSNNNQTISFNVNSEKQVKPDILKLRFSLSSTNKEAELVKNNINKKLDKIFEELKEIGVNRRDLQLKSFNIYHHQEPFGKCIKPINKSAEDIVVEGIVVDSDIKTEKTISIPKQIDDDSSEECLDTYVGTQTIEVKLEDKKMSKITDVIKILTKNNVKSVGNLQLELKDNTLEKYYQVLVAENMNKIKRKLRTVKANFDFNVIGVQNYNDYWDKGYGPIYHVFEAKAMNETDDLNEEYYSQLILNDKKINLKLNTNITYLIK